MAGAELSLERLLDSMTVGGELYEKHADGSLTCYACGHRCLIKPGRRGICKVRYNQDGELRVPSGYVGALQCDPTEKKPFFHVYPGSDTLTFGMLGCDMHCPYCFPPGTTIVTDRGMLPIEQVFALGRHAISTEDAEVADPGPLRTINAAGQWRQVTQAFKHHYSGDLTVIRPYYLPELRCTPDHRVYATTDPACTPEKISASQLTLQHYLAVPRHYVFSEMRTIPVSDVLRPAPVEAPRWGVSSQSPTIDVAAALGGGTAQYKVPHQLAAQAVAHIMAASSRPSARELGKDPTYIRHVRSQVQRGLWVEARPSRLILDETTVRFAKEHRPGLPARLAFTEDLARLLGYYCAEGAVLADRNRPNSHELVFAFGLHETDLAEETRQLIQDCLGLPASIVRRTTTLGVTFSKSSAALLFKALCGTGSDAKRVPVQLFNAPRPVVTAFLDAYWRADGHRYENGKLSATTKSRALAYGVAWLGLITGHLPSIYENPVSAERLIQGRRVRQSPVQYTVVWYEDDTVARKAITTPDYYLVPIRDLDTQPYDGDVYNLEVEGEHNYLANFALVGNCQNWVTSQALRDPASAQAGAWPQPVTPQQLVGLARQQGAQLVASSYNEPLITSEWAVSVFKEAVAAGLKCAFVSNGNATREVLEYIRPYVSAYKIDLKTMSDRSYRRLGAVLEHVLDGIRMVHGLGFWLEIVTLIVPGFNDSTEELTDAARFLASLSTDIPWHVTAFHQDYHMTDPDDTTAATLIRAAEIGQEAGLRYVYAGNLPGQVGDYEHTFCPNCHTRVVERYGYVILDYKLTAQGACPKCGTRLAGIWTDRPEQVRRHGPGAPRSVRSVINRYRSDLAR